MLSKNRRIPKDKFSTILKEGKRYNSPSLLLYIAKINQTGILSSKFSFSISKKVCPRAVDRNKHRRQGYSIIGKYIKKIDQGYFCFFSFKKGSSVTTFSVLEREILDLLQVSGVVS